MNSPAEDIKDLILLLAPTHVRAYGTDLFISEQPAYEDVSDLYPTIMVLFDTGGFPDEPNAALEISKPTVNMQVIGPRDDYSAAWDKANSIISALHGTCNQTVSGSSRIIGLWSEGPPIFLGKDSYRRSIFSCNFRMERVPIT